MRNLFLLTALFLLGIPCWAQGVYTAASCSLTDVNACIKSSASTCNLAGGGTGAHTVVDGDTVKVPAGNCTWSGAGSAISIPQGVGISIIGAGNVPVVSGVATTCSNPAIYTCITDSLTSGSLIGMTLQCAGASCQSTARISGFTFFPTLPATGYGNPIFFGGICSSTDCPKARFDHNTIPSSWFSASGVQDASFIIANNTFGVADHNFVGDTSTAGEGIGLANVGNGTWMNVGIAGDNSWAQPDTFGTGQAFYLENNTFNFAYGTDMDFPDNVHSGGGRAVCRFNTFTQITIISGCSNHGTDTNAPRRSGRQLEFYANTATCPTSCNALIGDRGGVSLVFGNQLTSGSANHVHVVDVQRRWRVAPVFNSCDGSTAFDTNDGVTYFTGTIGSVSGAGSPWVVTDSGTPGWTTNQWSLYSLHDTTSPSTGGFTMSATGSNTLTDAVITTGSAGAYNPTAGHGYQILRATVCMDQPARGAGALIIRTDNVNATGPKLQSTGLPGPVNQALDPIYVMINSTSGGATISDSFSTATGSIVANQDFYTEAVNGAAQSNSTTPFNGTSGVGHGTRANRPTTCTTGVGYYSTDQGSWNTNSVNFPGQSFSQGVLDICTATNTWTNAVYTPYTYPHPLITASLAPVLSFSPLPLLIGQVPIGFTSNPVTETITNTGNANLVTTSITIGNVGFTVVNNTCGSPAMITQAIPGTGFTLAPNASCTFQVTYAPTVLGVVIDFLNVTGNQSPSPIALNLDGIGTGPPAPTPVMNAAVFH